MSNQRGFTLLETIVVFILIAVLAAIAVPTYQDTIRRARQQISSAELASVHTGAITEARAAGRTPTLADYQGALRRLAGDRQLRSGPVDGTGDISIAVSDTHIGFAADHGDSHLYVTFPAGGGGVIAEWEHPAGTCAALGAVALGAPGSCDDDPATVELPVEPVSAETQAVAAGDPVELTVAALDDGTVTWDFGDGSSSETEPLTEADGMWVGSATHSYQQGGEFVATATVTAGDYSGQAVFAVTVSDPFELLAANTLTGNPPDEFRAAVAAGNRNLIAVVTDTALTAADTNGLRDVYLIDRAAGTSTLVSQSSAGVVGNGHSRWPSISADGRFVAFQSQATNLDPADGSSIDSIYLRDLLTGTTRLVSTRPDGSNLAGGDALYPALNADGRYLAFQAGATGMPGDPGGYDAWRKDLLTGALELVSTDSSGATTSGHAGRPDISDNGRFIVFNLASSSFWPGNTDSHADVYRKDMITGETVWVSEAPGGGSGDGFSQLARISGDGQMVVWESNSTNLGADANSIIDVFARDLRAGGPTTLVSTTNGGATGTGESSKPSLSPDGRFVAFHSFSSTFSAGDGSNLDVFIRDLTTGEVVEVSAATDGSNSSWSGRPAVAPDGSFAVFVTPSSVFTGERGVILGERR